MENQTASAGLAGPDGSESAFDVVLEKISHWYGANRVLEDVSLKIRKGEFFGILGPSGSGKTTTLRVIGGFVIPTDGEVYLENELMGRRPPYRRNTTMVFQHLALFPHLSVFANLAYGLKLRKVDRDEIKKRVARSLDMVQLSGLEDRRPKQLSGGQQQRVALARALILEPSVVLFDEPLGSLDLKLRREMQIELKRIQRRLGKTFVYVTHDQMEALNMCDRIAVMNNNRLEQIGTPEEIYEKPGSRFVADFIGDTNFISGKVEGREGGEVLIGAAGTVFRAPDDGRVQPGNEAAFSIRPERISIGPAAKTQEIRVDGVVREAIYAGARRRFLVVLPGDLTVKVDVDAKENPDLEIGRETTVGWSAGDAYLIG